MRYLHSVSMSEVFVASGVYKFFKEGDELPHSESWSIHEHPDGEWFVRVDDDSRGLDGKSLLLEALLDSQRRIVRFDVNYSNPKFENGIRTLRATFTLEGQVLQVGWSFNDAERQYTELTLPINTIIDIPLCSFRGRSTVALAEMGDSPVAVFLPLFEQYQLFPGAVATGHSPAEAGIEEEIAIGRQTYQTRRYRYPDRALTYWVDDRDIMIKRVSNYKQQEFVTVLTNYAHRPR